MLSVAVEGEAGGIDTGARLPHLPYFNHLHC